MWMNNRNMLLPWIMQRWNLCKACNAFFVYYGVAVINNIYFRNVFKVKSLTDYTRRSWNPCQCLCRKLVCNIVATSALVTGRCVRIVIHRHRTGTIHMLLTTVCFCRLELAIRAARGYIRDAVVTYLKCTLPALSSTLSINIPWKYTWYIELNIVRNQQTNLINWKGRYSKLVFFKCV